MTFQAICDKTGPEIAKQNTKICDAVPVPKRVAIVLWRLATGQLETPHDIGLKAYKGASGCRYTVHV